MNEPPVVDNPEAGRYEVVLGDAMAVLEYRRMGDRVIVFTHTGVPEALEGQGVGNRLVLHALEDARVRGLEVIPLCPFVAAYMQRHPAYLDMVSPRYKGFERA